MNYEKTNILVEFGVFITRYFFLYKFKDLLDIKNRDVLPIQKSIFSKFGKFKLFNYETYK